MPCTYTGSFEGDQLFSANEELDRLTLYLCAVCAHLEKSDLSHLILAAGSCADGVSPNEIHDWWAEHKQADAERMNAP